MRVVTLPAKPGSLFTFTNRLDAYCRNRSRCRVCNRALRHSERDCCDRCRTDDLRKEVERG